MFSARSAENTQHCIVPEGLAVLEIKLTPQTESPLLEARWFVMGGVICMETTADGTSALTIGVVLVVDHTKLVPELPLGKIGTWVSDVEGMLKGRPIGNNRRYPLLENHGANVVVKICESVTYSITCKIWLKCVGKRATFFNEI